MNTHKHVRIRRDGRKSSAKEGEEEAPLKGGEDDKRDQEEQFPDIPEKDRCWVCKKRPITYQPFDCDCAIYCRTCAMKLATAFHCKKCKQLSSGMRRTRR